MYSFGFLSSSGSHFPVRRLLTFRLKAEEWLYFHQGQARATVFLGGALARTFDFTAGDTAVFPDNSGESSSMPCVPNPIAPFFHFVNPISVYSMMTPV